MEEEFNIEEYPNLLQLFGEYREEVVRLLKQRLEENGRKASGQLVNNISTSIKSSGSNIVINLIAADYLKQTTEGRQPTQSGGDGTVQRKIYDWIQQKGILPTPREDKNGKTYLPTQEQLAFLIARKIHREGFKGDDILYQVLEEVNSKYIPLFNQALKKDFDDLYTIKIMDKINHMIRI